MNYYLSEDNYNTLAALSAANDEVAPGTKPKGGGQLPPIPPGGNPPPRKKLPPPGGAQQLAPKGGNQTPPPPPGKANEEGMMNYPPQHGPEKKINPLLLYGAGALALYFLFFKK